MGGVALVVGVVGMVVGAALYFGAGADLWAALSDGSIPAYLEEAVEHRTTLFVNLTVWILGATALSVGGIVLSRDSVARHAYQLGGALAVVSFITWMGLIRVAPTIDPATAELVGFTVTRLDDLATICLIGLGPVLLAVTSDQLPRRLCQAAVIVGAATVLSIVALFTDASASYGLLIVPAGLVWTLAAGMATLRADR
jgi:hypothetical protein